MQLSDLLNDLMNINKEIDSLSDKIKIKREKKINYLMLF